MGLSDFYNDQMKLLKEWAKLEQKWYGTFDNAAKRLVEAHNNKENIYIEFNGKKLYSCEIDSIDKAYQQYCGRTKAEFEQEQEKAMAEAKARREKREAEAKDRIPEWNEKGKGLILPGTEKEWARCVEIRAGDLYHGMELDNALDIMKALKEGDMDKAVKLFDDANHSGASAGITRSIILTFSEKGADFYEKTHLRTITPQTQIMLDQKRAYASALTKTYDEKEMKDHLLKQMKLTRTWIKPEFAEQLTSQENLENLNKQNPSYCQKDPSYIIVGDKQNGFGLRMFFGNEEAIAPVDVSKIGVAELAKIVEQAMNPHLSYGVWHGNPDISEKQVEATLQNTIATAHTVIENEKALEHQSSIADKLLEDDEIKQENTKTQNEIEQKNDEKAINQDNKNYDDKNDIDDR